ncbi:unnamed protein product, partial [Ectocarpus sp. 13 AM-2016]
MTTNPFLGALRKGYKSAVRSQSFPSSSLSYGGFAPFHYQRRCALWPFSLGPMTTFNVIGTRPTATTTITFVVFISPRDFAAKATLTVLRNTRLFLPLFLFLILLLLVVLVILLPLLSIVHFYLHSLGLSSLFSTLRRFALLPLFARLFPLPLLHVKRR